jgi:hypothetical protein
MKKRFNPRFGCTMLAALLVWTLVGLQPAHALIKMDSEGINLALKYGMQNSGLGLYALLGPNWVEGSGGALLNIYSPFMMLASKAARGGYPVNPSKDDIKNARKRYHKVIRGFTDVRVPPTVKFSVSLLGSRPDFAKYYDATIEGVGRGKHFKLRPTRSARQSIAQEVPNANAKPFEAINAYYFNFDDVANMDEFSLILNFRQEAGNPAAEPIVFRIRKDRIY